MIKTPSIQRPLLLRKITKSYPNIAILNLIIPHLTESYPPHPAGMRSVGTVFPPHRHPQLPAVPKPGPQQAKI